jgi:hypothetical protein
MFGIPIGRMYSNVGIYPIALRLFARKLIEFTDPYGYFTSTSYAERDSFQRHGRIRGMRCSEDNLKVAHDKPLFCADGCHDRCYLDAE